MIGSVLLPVLLLGVIAAMDRALQQRGLGVLATGLLDEPAHAATATLTLLTGAGWPSLRRHRSFALSAIAAAMAIDVDHLPIYLGFPQFAELGRPVTHSLTTAAVLALAWLISGRRWPIVAGAAVGVLLHFVRDVFTGPGVPLYWPLSDSIERLPYRDYWWLMVSLTALATLRALVEIWRDRRPGIVAATGNTGH